MSTTIDWPKATFATTAPPAPSIPVTDRWPDRLRQAWTVLRHGSGQLHILASVAITLPHGQRSDALDHLHGAGFIVDLFNGGQLVATLPMAKGRLMRPRPISSDRWHWTVMFDIEITVASRHTAAGELTAVVGDDSGQVPVLTVDVFVLRRQVVLPDRTPSANPQSLRTRRGMGSAGTAAAEPAW